MFSKKPSSSHADAPPTWQRPPNLALATAGVLSARGNLYFFVPHVDRAGERDGTADLACFKRGASKPLVVPVQVPPGFGFAPEYPDEPRFPWMYSFEGLLLIGESYPRGVMVIPWKDIDDALSAERAQQ